ncbi:single-stranded DNA-binding protein [candidate division WWE3 bacterium CG09_land_8_20_14_0_10_39_24]|uniref:Single-stranded DNA-binding protein n=2 Tax=Katanobacteria TaxID=422282 RepID=A0A2G9XBM5_UNCKA|nr:MAG: hypothetical protein BK003_00435 [bacterium CG09_39_24]PIP04364.1 MAG: single-stranded DNA-binding protein [candidate division WWE3 bacterium CG23_combo_of_CG06-09_8_20_14_all_40_14]PIS13115.1 MAG: single-stranded DNA-binding protein [candidate division WWE3 bacterium CG09_land_8_20_14_0_10_39_24]
MSRSINKAIILGNLTRDPEMRYTPQGNAVTSFAVATNRQWNTEDGTSKEAVEFHNIVAWNKLAEICSQLLKKGTKVYIEGRLQTRTWEDDKAVKHYKTEIVADDMILLSSKGPYESWQSAPEETKASAPKPKEAKSEKKEKEEKETAVEGTEEVDTEEMPF